MAAAAAAAQEERRRQLQEYLEAKKKLKCPSAKPYLKDRTNHLDPRLKTVSKPESFNRSKKDAVQNVAKGTCKDGKLAAKPIQPAGHGSAPQKFSRASQKVAVVHQQHLGKDTELPVGLTPSTGPSVQPRGRPPAFASCFLNPGGPKEAGSHQLVPGAPCSLNEGLQERLGCGKENWPAQAATKRMPSSTFQSKGNNLGNKRALAHGQSSGTVTSRTVRGPKDSCQTKEVPIQDKSRKPLPGSKSTSQKASGTTWPLQPPQLLAGSTHLLHKMPVVKHEKNNAPREPVGKLGMSLVGTVKHSSRAPEKPSASNLPRNTTNGPMKRPSPKLGTAVQWQRPTVIGGADRKDVKTAPSGHTATSQVGVPKKQFLPSTYSSKTQADRGEPGSRRVTHKPELPQKSGVHAGRVPKSSTPADRKKQLEQWLASKGKCYKRPPMTLPPKKPPKQKKPLFKSPVQEEQKPEKPEQLYLARVNALMTECLKLIEEGAPSEKLSAILCHVPTAEKCAKFWICKAKLLDRHGPFDVIGLYEAAVCAGAEPLQELREVVLDILKTTKQPLKGKNPEQCVLWKPITPCPGARQHVAVTPCQTDSALSSLPASSIKLQVTSVPRARQLPEGQELKFLTPVRCSLRIERVGSCYPEMLLDHDPVVSSLREILDDDKDTQFFFQKNKALPGVAQMEVLSL